MKRSRIHVLAATLLMILLWLGCDKAAPEKTATASDSSAPAATPKSDTIAHLHWLGKKRLAGETNAAAFMKIWNLPESARLEGQTLDKLATAPWRLLRHETNQPSTPNPQLLLRPLLDDLVQEESYVEIHGITNGPGDMVLAVRLPSDRAALWQTNLPAVMKSLGVKRADSTKPQNVANTRNLELGTWNWELQNRNSELEGWNLTLARSGDWTLLALGQTDAPAPHASLQAMARRIQTARVPFAVSPTNYWVDLGVNLPRVAQAFALGWNLPTNFPQASLTMMGEGGNVRTLAELRFPGGAPIQMEPWNIPTNLVHDPLIGFMAARGFRPLLRNLSLWDESRLGITPNQVCFWDQDGRPDLRFFAFPSPQASNQMHLLSEFLLLRVNPLIAMFPGTTNVPYGFFQQVSNAPSVRWRGLPYVSPNLNLVQIDAGTFITGGLFQNRITNQLAPDSLFQQFRHDSNLILYDWELTQPSTFGLIQMAQAARLIFGRNRLSLTNNPAQAWVVALCPLLGPSGSSVRLADRNRLAFSRSSSMGLTAVEIHLLVDWLESSNFPKGLFSLQPAATPKLPTQH